MWFSTVWTYLYHTNHIIFHCVNLIIQTMWFSSRWTLYASYKTSESPLCDLYLYHINHGNSHLGEPDLYLTNNVILYYVNTICIIQTMCFSIVWTWSVPYKLWFFTGWTLYTCISYKPCDSPLCGPYPYHKNHVILRCVNPICIIQIMGFYTVWTCSVPYKLCDSPVCDLCLNHTNHGILTWVNLICTIQTVLFSTAWPMYVSYKLWAFPLCEPALYHTNCVTLHCVTPVYFIQTIGFSTLWTCYVSYKPCDFPVWTWSILYKPCDSLLSAVWTLSVSNKYKLCDSLVWSDLYHANHVSPLYEPYLYHTNHVILWCDLYNTNHVVLWCDLYHINRVTGILHCMNPMCITQTMWFSAVLSRVTFWPW